MFCPSGYFRTGMQYSLKPNWTGRTHSSRRTPSHSRSRKGTLVPRVCRASLGPFFLFVLAPNPQAILRWPSDSRGNGDREWLKPLRGNSHSKRGTVIIPRG